ncbi:MAG: winged helix DNA-binding domain-containing protein [Gemmatimonadetes bacterium]|nr:winged helix DNA-binding domain-containing protein [Gemmatimonadota bacterium]
MVEAQDLSRAPRGKPTRAAVLETIRRMGALQIDTIHVVARSPYLVLWSRLGDYDPAWLDALLAEGRLFEYWGHEASFLPIKDYALFRHRMIDPQSLGWKYSHEWILKNADVVDRVRERIRAEGPLRSADFERTDGRKGGGWWGWKPEKRALEMLFSAGDLMVARRDHFQRVYDLRERVHAEWDDARLPPAPGTDRTLVERTLLALGVTQARWIGDYYRMARSSARTALRELIAAGTAREITVDGWPDPAYVHRQHDELLERARAGRLRPAVTTILSPFDPLIWDRARCSVVFGFDYRLECYVPAPKRRWGYFVLPILHRGSLIGRLDAKAHRSANRFEVRTLYLEDGVRGEAVARDVARALVRLARWHETPAVTLQRTIPSAVRAPLSRALRAAMQD